VRSERAVSSMSVKKKILVLDDNQDWLDTIETILAPTYDLVLFTDPDEAKGSLRDNEYSLVILDKNLPGTSGLDVLKEMREIAPMLRAIMLTGYADVESAVKSMKIGALDYVSKGTANLTTILRLRVEEALKVSEQLKAQEIRAPELIARGESATLEFKSSARWDYRLNKTNKELEKVIIKTVAAFMNSEHDGNLLIGVDDSGEIIGLADDYKTLGRKQDRDGYENFLMNILLDAYGKESAPFIHIVFHQMEGKDICQIAVKPSTRPVFVRDDKGEHLFIRTGNSTRALTTREAIEYCRTRWK
jgi:FixJ family two-component response regulator